MSANIDYVATAFISCSLRTEDKPFIDFVEKILIKHKIKPIGTVGKYSASPINTTALMKANIPLADIIVLVATPRYIQKDVHTGQISYGLSEMLHVEAGMAYMAGKPVIAFVKEGTHVGNFLPNITQYITLNGSHDELVNKWSIINSLLNSSYQIVKKIKESESSKSIGSALMTGLAVYGGIKILGTIFKEEKPKKKRKSVKKENINGKGKNS